MLLQYYFPNFHYAPVIFATVLCAVIGISGYALVFRTRIFESLLEEPIAANFISVPTTMFALVMAFMASAVWQNASTAKTSAWNEKMAIETIDDLPIRPQSLKERTAQHLKAYVDAVVATEWGQNRNQRIAPEVDAMLRRMEADAWALEDAYCEGVPAQARCSASVVTASFVRALEQLRLARHQRLSLGALANFGYVVKWAGVFLLALLATINLAAGHRKTEKSARLAIVIFCSCAAVLFSVVALHIHPYKGPDALEPSIITRDGA